MADALIPGYSLPEHLKSAKQIIPVTIDQTFENNYYKNPDEVLAFTKTPYGQHFWKNDTNYDFQKPWLPVLLNEYSLNSIPTYITFTPFLFRQRWPDTKYYGVEWSRTDNKYVNSMELTTQYGDIHDTSNISDGQYFPYYSFDGGITSCEVTFMSQTQYMIVPGIRSFIDSGEPFIKFQVSGNKLSLYTRMCPIEHTSNTNVNNNVFLFYGRRYIQMQGIISIF